MEKKITDVDNVPFVVQQNVSIVSIFDLHQETHYRVGLHIDGQV